MAVVRITEAEAIRDPAALFKQVRAGSEVVIEAEGMPIAVMSAGHAKEPGVDSEYDAWVVAQVDESLADPRESIDSEVVEAYFAKRRRASEMKMLGMAG